VTRRIVVRTAAALVAGGCAAAAALAPALPALAHGAPVQPISRTAACAGGGSKTGTAACKAALKANGQSFDSFDDLRVPDVDGRDRAAVPDGKLCSGGLDRFKGLDLARTDWPSTTLSAGGTVNVVYRAPIPHDGSFRFYLTRQGYDPAKPLRWSDLGSKPFLTVGNAKLSDGAYRMSGKLPADRTGHHVLYTIWQTTSTPDTYYSCSDVVLTGAGKGAAVPATTRSAGPTHSAKPLASRSAEPGLPATPGASSGPARLDVAPAAQQTWLSKAGDEQSITRGRYLMTAGLVVLAALLAGLAVVRIRRSRSARQTPGTTDLR
jgi:predicted carbohydrate-binding protein with CBM5 and CBM33 domain